MTNLTSILKQSAPNWRAEEVERCLRQRPIAEPYVDDVHITRYLELCKQLACNRYSKIRMVKFSDNIEYSPYLEVFTLIYNSFGARRFDGVIGSVGHQRSVLDALLLCRVDSLDIYHMTGISPEAVDIYSALYFDVRERPQVWIFSTIIQPLLFSYSAGSFDAMLKLASFIIGREGIEQLMFMNSLSKENMQKLQEQIKNWRTIKAAASSLLIPVNQFNHLDFEAQVSHERNEDRKLAIAEISEEDDDFGITEEERSVVNNIFGPGNKLVVASKYNKAHIEVTKTNKEENVARVFKEKIIKRLENVEPEKVVSKS